jgi:hypothetical protein
MIVRKSYKHDTGYGMVRIIPQGDHWLAYFIDDVGDDHRIRRSQTVHGGSVAAALLMLLLKAAFEERPTV